MSRNDDRFWNRPKGNLWSKSQNRRQKAPPHLKGKQIGLYFRDKNRGKKGPKELVITLNIPPAVETKVCRNLESIANLAEKRGIPTPSKESFIKIKQENVKHGIESCPNTDDHDNTFYEDPKTTWTPAGSCDETDSQSRIFNSPITNTKDYVKNKPGSSYPDYIPLVGQESNMDISSEPEKNFKVPNLPSTSNQSIKTEPGTSSAPNVIPLSNNISSYRPNDRLLSLRGGGDYKYGYEDIITGTFDEKLDECLSKGVKINFSNPDIKEISTKLHEEYKAMVTKNGYQKLRKFREILPAYKKSEQLIEVINNNQVVVISGETGCGKSTQVPQIILDHAICNNNGGNINILVTQPRRIAASSLAIRVAEERAESVGNSVGYAIRLEKVDPRPRGSIIFCTTGILLADLEINQGLTNYSHVILDEVHERDCHIDFSMCMLKKVLQKRKDLKLILMSATIDADSLSAYFDNCPMMHIEGLAYPVKDIYLEEILKLTKFKLDDDQKKAPKGFKHGLKRQFIKTTFEQDIQYRAEVAPWLESIKKKIDRDVYETLQDSRIEELNVDLIFELIVYLCHEPPGAILVFLPGIADITKLIGIMTQSCMFPNTLYEIYPLHSKLPSLQQHRIFERPPMPIRKIIIATNIAETSITIDDIVYVIDSGKIKMAGLNVAENISTLKTEWVSQANLRQRRGRAGRCQPGICYHLVTSFRAQLLPDRLSPELQRNNLLEPVLTIKRLRLGMACEALMSVPAPPAESTIRWAVKHLQQCGALDDAEKLTPLGWHLARLPVHPSAGKLLVLGALFGCLDRAASVAAVWGFKDPFQLVIGKEKEADEAKRHLALGEPSDHVAISEAIIQWENCPPEHRRSFAYEHFLSHNTIQLLSDMKRQLGDSLRQMGFLTSGNVKEAWENRNAGNLSLFKGLVAASLYPNIATVRWSNSRNPRKQAQIRVRTPEDSGGVQLHPSSVMTTPFRAGYNVKLCDNPGANWLVYWLKQRSSNLFLLEVTLVYTLPLLFFGELNVTVDEEDTSECYMAISTVKVRCKRETAEILYQLRTLLDQVLASKVMISGDHAIRHCDFEECVLEAVIELLTAEDEQADYLDYDDRSESDNSEYESNQHWNRGRRGRR